MLKIQVPDFIKWDDLKKKLFINQILAHEIHKVLTSPYHPSLNATELLRSQLNGGWLTKQNFQGHICPTAMPVMIATNQTWRKGSHHTW
jgi:hypothetical protein